MPTSPFERADPQTEDSDAQAEFLRSEKDLRPYVSTYVRGGVVPLGMSGYSGRAELATPRLLGGGGWSVMDDITHGRAVSQEEMQNAAGDMAGGAFTGGAMVPRPANSAGAFVGLDGARRLADTGRLLTGQRGHPDQLPAAMTAWEAAGTSPEARNAAWAKFGWDRDPKSGNPFIEVDRRLQLNSDLEGNLGVRSEAGQALPVRENSPTRPLTVGDVVHAPDLFTALPRVADTPVSRLRIDPNKPGLNGSVASDGAHDVALAGRNVADIAGLARHEIGGHLADFNSGVFAPLEVGGSQANWPRDFRRLSEMRGAGYPRMAFEKARGTAEYLNSPHERRARGVEVRAQMSEAEARGRAPSTMSGWEPGSLQEQGSTSVPFEWWRSPSRD